MTIITTQNDFKKHMNKLDWLKRHTKAQPGSLEFAVAEDKLKEYKIIPDNDPELIDEDYNKYWKQFN